MSIEKIYDYLPNTKEGRTVIGLAIILVGLLASAGIFTIVLIPLGIIILAYDYEWARNLLRRTRDWLSKTRDRRENMSRGRQNRDS